MMTIGVLAFVVALLVSVMLHEGGHFLTAKLFKMKATQFFVGFGPTLWSRQKGETEYGIKAIPAGGFVKIIGMTPLEDVAPEDQPRAFINKPGWQRFIVLVAGSSVHFVIALVLFFVALVIWPTVANGPAKVHAVQACVAVGTQPCANGDPAAPANGVLQAGDLIVSVDGHQVTKGADQLIAFTQANGPGPLTYVVQRGGSDLTVTVQPVVVAGKVRVGIEIENTGSRALGFAEAVPATFKLFGTSVRLSFGAIGKVPHEIGNIFSSKHTVRTVDGSGASVTSVVGVARIVGEGFSTTGVSGGIFFLVTTIASVNLFVGLFNLFPFLPLDGGHVAILFYEKIRDAWRRLRRLPKAGPVDLTKLMPVTYGALAIIVTVSALILFADISNPTVNPFQ